MTIIISIYALRMINFLYKTDYILTSLLILEALIIMTIMIISLISQYGLVSPTSIILFMFISVSESVRGLVALVALSQSGGKPLFLFSNSI